MRDMRSTCVIVCVCACAYVCVFAFVCVCDNRVVLDPSLPFPPVTYEQQLFLLELPETFLPAA